MRLVTSSGTYSPASMYSWAFLPSGVPSETLARKMSPVEIAGMPKWSATTLAWVPFPAPGGPIRINLMSAQEPFVVALLELTLDLLHRVECDAHHDQDRGAAEGEVLVGADQHEGDQRDQGDQTEVHGAWQRDAGQDVGQVVLGRLARPDPGDEAAVLLHVVRHLFRVEGDRDVEVGEEDDECEEREHVERVVAADEVLRDPHRPARPRVAVELSRHGGQVEQRGREDHRDHAGLVDLERYVGRRAAEHLAPHHPAGVLHRYSALRLFDEDDRGDDDQADRDHDREDPPPLGLAHGPQRAGEPGHDLGEDQDRHAVADTAVGYQLPEPHDRRGARGHRDHHGQERLGPVVVEQRLVASLEQVARAGQRHDAGRLEHGQAEGQVTGVLGDLGLAGLTFLLQRFEPWDHHDEQLQDDAGGDVGHDAQREDGQLEQGPAGEDVDQVVDAAVAGTTDAVLDVGHVHARGRDLGADPEDHDDPQDEQQLLAQVRRAERVDVGA